MTTRDDPQDQDEREALRARVGDADEVERAACALIAGDIGPIAEPLVEAGFGIPTIEIDPPEDALDLAPLVTLHRYWRARCGPGGALPPASAIDLAELRETSENIGHLRTDGTGHDFVYAAYVPAVAQYAGRDWTGWSIGAIALKFANAHGILYRALHVACAHAKADRLPARGAGLAWRDVLASFGCAVRGRDGRRYGFLGGERADRVPPAHARRCGRATQPRGIASCH